MNRRRGYTAIEMMCVVVVVAIVAVILWPDEEAERREQARLAAEKIEADVSYARSLSIANPGDPAAIKIDPGQNRYHIARQSDVDTPIKHPTRGKPYIVQFGPGGDPGFDKVSLDGAEVGGGDVLLFESSGRLATPNVAVFQVSAGDAKSEVLIAPAAANTTIGDRYTKTVSLDKSTEATEPVVEEGSGGEMITEPKGGMEQTTIEIN